MPPKETPGQGSPYFFDQDARGEKRPKAPSGMQQKIITLGGPPEEKEEAPAPTEQAAQGAKPVAPKSRQKNHIKAKQKPGLRVLQHPAGKKAGQPLTADKGAEQPPKTQHLTHREIRRRRNRRALAIALGVLALLALAVTLCFTLLFRVRSYTFTTMDGVETADLGIYSQQELLDTLAIPENAGMFSFSVHDKTQELLTSFPYLDQAEVRRQLPRTIEVRVQPAQERYAVPCNEGWAVVSSGRRVLAVQAEQPALTVLEEVSADAPVPGSPLNLQLPDTADAETVQSLLDALGTQSFAAQVNSVQLTDTSNLSFVYQGRIRVLLGTGNRLEYKLEWAQHLLENVEGKGLSETDRGTLNISSIQEDGTISPVFTPE